MSDKSLQTKQLPNLSEQLACAQKHEAELLHSLIGAKTRAEHDAITFRRVKAIRETERILAAIASSNAAFISAINQTGRSEFVD